MAPQLHPFPLMPVSDLLRSFEWSTSRCLLLFKDEKRWKDEGAGQVLREGIEETVTVQRLQLSGILRQSLSTRSATTLRKSANNPCEARKSTSSSNWTWTVAPR